MATDKDVEDDHYKYINSLNAPTTAGCRTGDPKLDKLLVKTNREKLRIGTSNLDMAHPIGSPKNYSVKQEAQLCLLTGNNYFKKGETKLGNLNYEKEYKIVFDELVVNEKEWMDFFDESRNLFDINYVCGMLECLAIIYCRRRTLKSYEDCGKVLDMFAKVMQKWEQATATPPSFEEAARYKEIYIHTEFNYNNIRFQQLTGTNRIQEAVPCWRKCIEFEFYQCGGRYIPIHERAIGLNYLPYLQKYLSWDLKDITQQNVTARVSDKAIMYMIKTQTKHEKNTSAHRVAKEKALFALKVCSCCGKEESWMKEFKGCSKCGNAFYCGRDCQVQNWKKHKKVCVSKK